MIVIGAGRVGTGLETSAKAQGLPMTLIDRTTGWDVLDGPAGDPVVVAVRNDDLDDVLRRIPAHRREDLVFVQNGAIREWLASAGLADTTRGVLYVLAARRGEPPTPGGNNVFTGPQSVAVASWLGRIGLPSDAVDRAAFAEVELEKLLWLACNGVLCEVHGVPVGQLAVDRREELAALVAELAAVGRAAWGVRADERWLVERIVAYSLAIPEYRASVKEWPWRNGWLRDQAERHAVPTPIHDRLLAQLGR